MVTAEQWGPLEETAVQEDAAAVGTRAGSAEDEGAVRDREQASAQLQRASKRSWRDSAGWTELAHHVHDLKHDVSNVRAEIKGDVMEASKEMREIKAQLSQLVYRKAERVHAVKQAELVEREEISKSAATMLLEQEGMPVPEQAVVQKSGGSRAGTPDKVDGWTEDELALVKGPLSTTSRLVDSGTESRGKSPERPKSRGKSPERPRSRGKSPPLSPKRNGAAPWANTEVDGVPVPPDPDGPDGIDGGRFPRLPMSPTPPRLARPPSADLGNSKLELKEQLEMRPVEEPQMMEGTPTIEDPYAVLGDSQAAGDVQMPGRRSPTVCSSPDGEAPTSTQTRHRSASLFEGTTGKTSRKPSSPTLSKIKIGELPDEQAPKHWGFPDQFFDSLPRAEAGGATSNMMPVTTGGYEFRPNMGAGDERDQFGGGGAQPYLERDIAVIMRHQVREHERRTRSRLQSRHQRREGRNATGYSSRDEHMGGDPSNRAGMNLRLPKTPPHSGSEIVGGEPIAPRPASVSSMSHTPDSATLSNLAIVPRPSSRDGVARTGGLLWGEASPPLSPVSSAVRNAMAAATHDKVKASGSGALIDRPIHLDHSQAARTNMSHGSIDWVAVARENARDFRKGSGNPRRQSDYNHPHWSAVARPVNGTRGSPGMSLLERANPANTRSYTLGRWHNRQKRLINETSLFGRYVINPRAAKALGLRSRSESSMYPTLGDSGKFRADSNPGLFDTGLKL